MSKSKGKISELNSISVGQIFVLLFFSLLSINEMNETSPSVQSECQSIEGGMRDTSSGLCTLFRQIPAVDLSTNENEANAHDDEDEERNRTSTLR